MIYKAPKSEWTESGRVIDIVTFFNNDVIMSSLVTNLNSSAAQEIVNWVTTADGCVHTADTAQLHLAVSK